MWNYDSESEGQSSGYDDQDLASEEEYYEPYDPSNMTCSCRYNCAWNNNWCSFDVTTPQLNWSKTAQSDSASPALPPGVTEKIVANPHLIGRALDYLCENCEDNVFALDCEWRPSVVKGERNKVALLTIAAPDKVVLLRLCRMYLRGGVLPDVLMDFFEDEGNHFLGNGWHSDSSALEYSYDVPPQTWDSLVDIQNVAREMHEDMRVGLKHTVQHFLGFNPPKGRQVTLGDWEAPRLTDAQINYAMLDALYVGEVFRKMRSIHEDDRWY